MNAHRVEHIYRGDYFNQHRKLRLGSEVKQKLASHGQFALSFPTVEPRHQDLPLFNLELKKLISAYLKNTGRLNTSWPVGALLSNRAAA
jgi:hypothetical protein